MDFKRLKAFISIAKFGSLSKASDRLQLAQPALSRQIKMLEKEIGVELFSRHARGMELTEEGASLLERITDPMKQLENSLDHIRSMVSDPHGKVVLGIVPTVSDIFSAQLAIEFKKSLPNTSVRIVEGYGGHLIDWLYRGEIDMAIIYGPSSNFHCHTKELFYEELYLVGTPKAMKTLEKIDFKDICNFTLVLPSLTHGLRNKIEATAKKTNVALNIDFEADSFTVLKDLVMEGSGFTVLPKSALRRDLPLNHFATAKIENPKIMRQIILAQPADQPETYATKSVADICASVISNSISSGMLDAIPGKDLP